MRTLINNMSLSLIGALLLAATGTYAAEIDEAARVMLPIGSETLSSQTLVKVRIFPHDRDYKPQGVDLIRDRFTIRSQRPCLLYRAAPNKLQAQGAVLQKSSVLQLSLAELSHPLVIRCPDPFTLERQGVAAHLSYSYRGSLYVRAYEDDGKKRALEAINVISLSEYLRGVVPSEVYQGWAMEALKTQAVAARTYAAFHLIYARRFEGKRLWDVDDTIAFQAYTGVSLLSERTDQAVRETEGQILTYHGQVIQAYYHADSGGQTEEALSVWSRAVPFTVARPEASGLELNKSLWERSFTLEQLNTELRRSGQLEAGQLIKNVLVPVVGRTQTGRVRSLALIDQKNRHKLISIQSFRRFLVGMPSNMFVIEKDPKTAQFLVKGIGNGHGVGMSQQGAAALAAEKSWSYRQILDYYYVRTTLCSLDGRSPETPECKQDSAKVVVDRAARPPAS